MGDNEYMLKMYFVSLLVFLGIDMVWLGVLAKDFYRRQIGGLMRNEVGWGWAVAFYLLFVVGLVVFVISPAVENRSITQAVTRGVLFGLITYATYDLTNMATLKGWSWQVTVVDLIWGMVLSGLVAMISSLVLMKWV